MPPQRGINGRFEPTVPTVHISKAAKFPSGAKINGAPSGATGLKRTGGYIFEEFLKELQGQNASRIYQEMTDNDPIIGAMFFSIEMFLRKVNWFVDPATEDADGEAKAQFLEECKDDMSHTWADFISEALSMLPHGWSFHETLYKRRTTDRPEEDEEAPSKFNDGKIGWRKFEIRSQDSLDRWDFDDDGGIRGLFQRPAPNYQELYIPIKKALLFRTQVRKNNPEGRSILRNAYRPWYFKKRTEEIEGIGVERDLAGLPFAEVPAEMMREDASDADKATLASIVQLVKNVRRDEQEGVVWPQSWDEKGTPQYTFKLLNAGGSRQFSTDTIITRYEQRMAMCALADFILLGNDSSGSFALATSKTGMFQAALGAWLGVIRDVLNNYAVPRLFRLNGIEGPYPKFRHDSIQKPALADLGTLVAALAGAGAQLFPDVELENWFKDLAGMPVRNTTPQADAKENDLRQKKLEADIATSSAAIDQAKNPEKYAKMGQPKIVNAPLGKGPRTKPGAPTKTTGAVKSKLPPQSRRNTASVKASQNVAKAEEILKRGFDIHELRILSGLGGGRWTKSGGGESKKVKSSAAHKVDTETVLEMTGGSAEHHVIHNSDGTFNFSPEREALHKSIIASVLKGQKPQKSPKFNIMGGGPAAGKSTMEAANPNISKGAALVNADLIKAMLPEYGPMIAAKDDTAAAFTHAESSYLVKRIQKEAFDNKFNVTLDGTGDSSVRSLMKKVSAAKEAGYQVNGFYVTIPTDVAAERALKRGKSEGRVVPEKIIRDTHKNVSLVFPEVMNQFDSMILYDNMNGLQTVVEKKPGSKAVILDQKLWAEFLAKGK